MDRQTAADDRPQIQRTLTRLRDATDLPLAFGGGINANRQVWLTQFAGSTTGALRGVALDLGLGLGGRVAALRRPMVVDDYAGAAWISHHYDHIIAAEGLHAMVAVPVLVGRTVRGVLYGAQRNGLPLGDRVIQAALESARDLEQSLAVRDEITRRLDWLGEHAVTAPVTPQWELVREAYAELRVLANDVRQHGVRERIEDVCRKLSPAAGTGSPDTAPALSARELDVLACVALGWTNAQVAADLDIKLETVKSYLRSVMRKLAAHSRLEAVVTARRYGLLP
ncbi:helix-turn-helix transcriptional regulator [Amycolatopsis lurida]